MAVQSPAPAAQSPSRVVLALSAAYFCLTCLPSFNRAYGYFIDELYYLACAQHLAFGYVDHPPLSIVLLSAITSTIGDSLPALRLVPALAGAATVFVTGVLAHRLGAGAFGQAIAAGAVMVGGFCTSCSGSTP